MNYGDAVYGNKLGMQNMGGLAGAAGLGSCAAPINADLKRRPELEEYMVRIDLAIGHNQNLVSQLGERLQPVLRCKTPCNEQCEPKANIPGTYYGQQMQLAIDRVASVNGVLQDLLDRLEA